MSDHPWINESGGLIAGIYHGMRDADYQAIDALRASTMKEALQSAKQLRHRMQNKRPDTGALRLGRAVHVAVLQPDVYCEETATIPEEFATSTGLSRKKPAQAWAQEFIAAGVTVITEAEDTKAQDIADAVSEHAPSVAMLERAAGREVTALWQETTPMGATVWCKARADFIGGGLLGDLKTTRETGKFSAAGMGGVIARFGYHFQMGWYSRGFASAAAQSETSDDHSALEWGWIFVQSEPPHDVIACEADDEMEDLGRWYAQSVWEEYAAALDSDDWPGVEPDLVTVSLPRWAVPQADKEDDYLEGM